MELKPTKAQILWLAEKYNTVPLSTTLPATVTPTQVLQKLKTVSRHCYMLESCEDKESSGRYTFLGFDPQAEIHCKDGKGTVIDENGSRTFTGSPKPHIAALLERHKSPRLRELPTFTGCDWRLIEKDVLNELARRSYFSAYPELERAQVGVEWVDQKYYFYRSKGSDEKPDALLLKQLKLLQEYTPGRICISLCGNLFQVFIQNRVLSRNVSLAATLTVQQISACPFPELEYLVRMARLITRQEQEVLVPVQKQEEPAASQPQKAAQSAEEGAVQEQEEDKDQA
mgnify:CR=1 FL=1